MYEIILFDLDGTLTDPKIGITKSVQYALEKMGITEDNLDNLTPFIGPPLLASFKDFYNMNDAEAKLAIEYYRERFSKVGLYENTVYAGMKELLQTLQNQGKTLFVATSKPTVFSLKILEHFGLAHFFTKIIGSELDGTRVDKGEVIKCVLEQTNGADLSKIIMVGDRKFDVVGAQENNIAVIGVSYGYGSLDELKLAKPNFIADSIIELGDFLCQRAV